MTENRKQKANKHMRKFALLLAIAHKYRKCFSHKAETKGKKNAEIKIQKTKQKVKKTT